MVNCLMSWFVWAKDTSFSQTMHAININKKPDTTAESHLNQVAACGIREMQSNDILLLQKL